MNSSTIQRIFNNPTIAQEINDIHVQIYKRLNEIGAHLPSPKDIVCSKTLTILDILCHPEGNGMPTIPSNILTNIQKELYAPKPVWKKFGVYNQIQCSIMAKMAELCQAAKTFGIDLDSEHAKEITLQQLGALAIKPSTALAIKYAWLYYKLDDFNLRLTEKFKQPFYGHVSCTTPVKNFFTRFFKIQNINTLLADEITFNIAHETNLDPIDINTAMWILGQN